MKNSNSVLHVVTNLSDGGLEKIVYLIIKNLSDERFSHNIAVLTKADNEFLVNKLKELSVNIVYYDFDNRIFKFSSIFKNIFGLTKLSLFIRRNKINVIHSHDFFPAFIARLAYINSVMMFHKPGRNIVTLHNIFFWLNNIHHKINRCLSIFTTRIVCVSESVLDYSLKHDKIPAKKYLVIFNGVESDLYGPDPNCVRFYRKEFGLNEKNFVIGNIGVLSVRKGQKYLLLALSVLIKKYPQIRVIIIGSERPHEKEISIELTGIIEDYKLRDYVKTLEPREDINKIYNIFDIYVMPSISEGQSLSAIEAMLNSKICLFSDIGPFKEMIDDGVNGFLFKSESVADLSGKIEYIIENFSRIQNVGKKAREAALQRYNVLTMCENYRRLYDGL